MGECQPEREMVKSEIGSAGSTEVPNVEVIDAVSYPIAHVSCCPGLILMHAELRVGDDLGEELGECARQSI